MNMKRYAPLLLLLLLALPLWANTDSCRFVKIEAQRLADLTMPRAGHAILRLGDEVVAFGGHTTGFVPTPTAEYLKDGKWHLMDMTYTHDNSLCVPLRSGKVLLAGGSEKPLGIGQTYWAEMYDPTRHTFEGFGCLDHKRALAAGVELDSGRVVIAGNWYDNDCMELFDGESKFHFVKELAVGRGTPWLLRIARDDALLFSSIDTIGNPTYHNLVERFRGDAFSVPLLDDWQPLRTMVTNHHTDGFVGDVSRDCYAHLFPVENKEGQMAICLLRDTVFSLLPTDRPIPMSGPFGRITYYSSIIVDRAAKRGYFAGFDGACRLYVLVVDYGKALTDDAVPTGTPASLTLRYTDVLPDCGFDKPVLTQDGNLLMAGGIGCLPDTASNFKPYRAVYLLPLAGRAVEATGSRWWYLPIASALAVLLLAALWFVIRRRRREHPQNPEEEDETLAPNGSNSTEHLMQRIVSLMETQRLYLRPDLKLSDVAALLGINSRYISDCINSARGCSFSQFVNGYRVERAKQLIRQQPEKKTTMLYMEVGFANETSFFRTFKSLTGMTPSEWRQQLPS